MPRIGSSGNNSLKQIPHNFPRPTVVGLSEIFNEILLWNSNATTNYSQPRFRQTLVACNNAPMTADVELTAGPERAEIEIVTDSPRVAAAARKATPFVPSRDSFPDVALSGI
jgi:hypothetical protein